MEHIIRLLIALLAVSLFTPSVGFSQPREVWSMTYDANLREDDRFSDVYCCQDGGFIFCGNRSVNNVTETRITRVDQAGEVLWNAFPQNLGRGSLVSIVETDDGGFIAVGTRTGAASDVQAVRIRNDGEIAWARLYDYGGYEYAYAVIELKSNDFLIAGSTTGGEANQDDGYLLKINADGDPIWEQFYGGDGIDRFVALRETEGGYLAAGTLDRTVNARFWFMKINENGESIWNQQYGNGRPMFCTSMATSRGGGYVLAGSIYNEDRTMSYTLLKVNGEGEVRWSNYYQTGQVFTSRTFCESVISVSGFGYALVGELNLEGRNPRWRGLIVRTDDEGNEIWRHILPGDGDPASRLWGVSSISDGGIIGIGDREGNETMLDGWAVRLTPDRSPPEVVRWSPEELLLEVLCGDTVSFSVHATDAQNDSLHYLWFRNDESIGCDTSVDIHFPNLGEELISCRVSDADQSDSVTWRVTVLEFFILASSPDTLSLALRRATTQTFSIDSVRAIEGDPVQYQWTLTNIDNFEREDAGMETGATVEFLRSGNYQIEGLAYRGESSDNVVWTIQVRSAILDFWPRSLNLLVPADSLVNCGVLPFNPASDSLSYRWEVDGDSVGSDSTVGLRFEWNGYGAPSYRVAAIVMDGAEGDTVKWEVTVQDPNATPPTPPSIEGGEVPTTLGITSVSPNPFNNSTTIRYSIPAAGRVKLTLHDLTGREVRECECANVQAGEHSYTLNGTDLPAGIYLLNLRVGNTHKVAKVAIVR